MSDEFGNTPPAAGGAPPEQPWTQAPPPPTGYAQAPPASSGLSDTAAGALAYVTILPAILFLVLAPYNQKPFVKFHAFQCIGLAVTGFVLSFINIVPILGSIVFLLASLGIFVVWILCILKASQGGAFVLPVIGKFASEQSGYVV
jgi:uncharacterized membrane protein